MTSFLESNSKAKASSRESLISHGRIQSVCRPFRGIQCSSLFKHRSVVGSRAIALRGTPPKRWARQPVPSCPRSPKAWSSQYRRWQKCSRRSAFPVHNLWRQNDRCYQDPAFFHIRQCDRKPEREIHDAALSMGVPKLKMLWGRTAIVATMENSPITLFPRGCDGLWEERLSVGPRWYLQDYLSPSRVCGRMHVGGSANPMEMSELYWLSRLSGRRGRVVLEKWQLEPPNTTPKPKTGAVLWQLQQQIPPSLPVTTAQQAPATQRQPFCLQTIEITPTSATGAPLLLPSKHCLTSPLGVQKETLLSTSRIWSIALASYIYSDCWETRKKWK